MSNPQVERLEALLVRVQRNRNAARAGNGAAQPLPFAAPAPAPAPAQRRAEPAPAQRRAEPAPAQRRADLRAEPAPAAAPARGKPAPTPLEMALEGRTSRSTEQLTQPLDVRPLPGAMRSAPPTEGRVLAEPSTPDPSKPIAHVVSKQPPHAAATFGDLLRRSLSLRPR